jgi:flagellin-like protein
MWANKAQRWRRKNKRAVSPIIATILLVAITVVLAAVLYVLISGLVHGPGNTPIGSALGVVGATLVQPSSAANVVFGTGGPCSVILLVPDYCYTVTITSASTGVTLSSLNFQVLLVGGGVDPLAAATGVGVSITNIAGKVLVYDPAMAFTSWPSADYLNGGSATTQVTTSMTIWIDMGSGSPAGAGDSLAIFGVGSYSGSESVGLP